MFPKMFSLSKIFCIIWLISQSYFPLTFNTMNTICEMTVKWLLLNFHVFTIVTMLTPIIIKPRPKFLWTSGILLETSFTRYQLNYILKSTIQIFWSNLICAFCTKWCKIPRWWNIFVNFTSRSFRRATPTLVFNLRYLFSHEDIL